MAIYRESPSPRRFIPIIALAVAAVIIVVVLLAALSSKNGGTSNNTAPIDSGLSASAALDKVSTSLELFQIEYAKISSGSAANQTGAPGAITTAINTLSANTALPKLNKVAFANLQADLGTLIGALQALPPPDIKKILSDAQTQLQALRTATMPATAAP